jgi:hypothetical protein
VRVARLLAAVALLATAGVAAAAPATPPWSLPHALAQASAGTDGSLVYVFGGVTRFVNATPVPTDEILSLDPATGAVTTLDARLPAPLAGAAVAYDGKELLLFGGWLARDEPTDHVLAFTPPGGPVRALPRSLPTPTAELAAVWMGSHALLFGGHVPCAGDACPALTDSILVYDPATGLVAPANGGNARLPDALADARAIVVGPRVVLWSGDELTQPLPGNVPNPAGPIAPTDRVYLYDATRGAAFTLAARLPAPRDRAALAEGNGSAFLVGGAGPGGAPAGDVPAFDEGSGLVRLTNATLGAAPRTLAAAAQVGDKLFLVGGAGCGPTGSALCDTVLEYDLSSGRPVLVDHSLAGRSTPGAGLLVTLATIGVLAQVRRRARGDRRAEAAGKTQ